MLGLDRTFRTLSNQLSGFSGTTKLLIGSLLMIMVLTLVMVALVTGRAEMVPLGLGAHLTPEIRARAISYLDERRVPWQETSGGDVLVPIERKYTVLAQLTENELITTDQIDFGSIIQDDSPFVDRGTKQRRYLVAKMHEVERMIGALEGIQKATVVIDQPDGPAGFGLSRIQPTASVTVLTRSGALGRDKADAIARMVAGVHAELKTTNVTIVDARNGRAIAARGDDDLAASVYLETTQEQERHHRSKIDEFLSYIPGVRVAVSAQVDGSEVVSHRVGVEEPKIGVLEENNEERNASNRSRMGEPGIRANAGDALVAGGGRNSSLSENASSTKTLPAFGTEETNTRHDRWYALKINATIGVPRSWFVLLYNQEAGENADPPDAAALQQIADAETQRIRAEVEPLIETDARDGALPGTVVVSMYNDLNADGVPGAAGMAGGLGGDSIAGGLVSESIIRSVTLGALAVVSLALMFMMVRKASRQEEMPTAEELVGIPPALAEADADLVGEADETVAAMEGVEIDEGSVRRQQMLDQINDLAVNNSDEVAGLLRKWIKTDE